MKDIRMDMMEPVLYSASEGITLRAIQTQKFKTGMLSVSLVLPIERETTPLTSLLLAVLRRGTEVYPSLEAINRRLDYLYGTELSIRNFYRGDNQIVGFSAEMLNDIYLPVKEDLPRRILEIMAQILFHPLLDEEGMLLRRHVESEKQMQCDSIRSTINHPRAYAFERFREIFYQNEPYGTPIYGTVEQVAAVTVEQLTAHWRALLEKIHFDCFYVGPEDGDRICQVLRETLGSEIHGRAVAPAAPRLVCGHASEGMRRAGGELPVSQGHLVIGLRTGRLLTAADYPALGIWNEMLGVSPISRLFLNVRERKSLCYSCSSSLHGYKGTIEIYCGLERSRRKEAEQEIFCQIQSLSDGEFDDFELKVAKKSLENACRQLQDSPSALENYYYGRALFGIDASLETVQRRYEKVTREDVLAVAKDITVDTVYFLDGTLAEGEEEIDEEI